MTSIVIGATLDPHAAYLIQRGFENVRASI